VYAQDLAQRVPTRAWWRWPIKKRTWPKDSPGIRRSQMVQEPQELLADKEVEAVAVVTSTSTHKEVVLDAVRNGKAVFLREADRHVARGASEMLATVKAAGVFFSAKFSTAVDAGYVRRRGRLQRGDWHSRVLTSTCATVSPATRILRSQVSGGLIADMGIHDFDVARMYMGDVKSVYAVGCTLAYPEMKSVATSTTRSLTWFSKAVRWAPCT